MPIKRRRKKFKVCITETLERVIEVRALSAEDAVDKVISDYKYGKHVLGADDFTGVSIDILED